MAPCGCWPYRSHSAYRRYDWEKIGEVVGGNHDTVEVGGKVHGGQSWDYVFDVDAEEGAPPKKLPANRGEDPYVVADRFLVQEGLPVSYRRAYGTGAPSARLPCPDRYLDCGNIADHGLCDLTYEHLLSSRVPCAVSMPTKLIDAFRREQIAQFIVQNSHGGISFAAVPMNYDPLTGQSAYVPMAVDGRTTSNGSHLGRPREEGSADPFTGTGAYVPGTSHGPSGTHPAAGRPVCCLQRSLEARSAGTQAHSMPHSGPQLRGTCQRRTSYCLMQLPTPME